MKIKKLKSGARIFLTDIGQIICTFSYNKKERALDLLTSFRSRIIDDLDKIENLKVVYLVIRDDGIYICIKPSKFIEKIVTLDHVFKKVTQAVTASLHFYW